ncbi:adhesin [Vibrio sagamiensis]|uniref:adhesin n=1 Tax=Vibrio sagamiensis TaxID=512650 RepID=UPI001FD10B0F|nr:adhesin [Vibrio sagamiensis]
MALACYSEQSGGIFGGVGPGGVTTFKIDPSASVPSDAPDGQIVWRGVSQTVRVTCYKDATHYYGLMTKPEQVYFWPGKTGDTNVAAVQGIKIGFRYNGKDIYGEKMPVDGFIVPSCKSSNIYDDYVECENNTKTSTTITYQPIIVTGPGDFSGYRAPINIFQLDGEFGYNKEYSNYRSVIGNMGLLKPSKCSVELEVQNNGVDYGVISMGASFNEVTEPLTIVIRNLKHTKDCPLVKLRGYFNNLRAKGNKSYIPVFDEENNEITSFAIELYTLKGDKVILNEPIGKGFNVEQIGYERYLAKLVPLGNGNIKKGKFSGLAVYTVSYL